MNVFERRESEVRSYCRAFPAVFERAVGAEVFDTDGRRYVDFFAGAGVLNYGHNNPKLKQALIDYLEQDGITHALDMSTAAKERFLETFERVILEPRGMNYKVQFTGPTGTNAIEAALKIARKSTGRANVIAFTNGYHGLTAGALALTGNRHFRHAAFATAQHVTFMPFDGFLGPEVNTVDYLRAFLEDSGSGVDLPAAIVLETVQAEGGIRVARPEWLHELAALCREFEILLVVDDIQAGCGRTGSFFSFDDVGLEPDIVTLSKAIGGYGLPMSLVLLKPEVDQWAPAEHTGTFRGHNLAFVAGTAALSYWETDEFAHDIQRKARLVQERLEHVRAQCSTIKTEMRGKGLLCGFELPEGMANAVSKKAFSHGLIAETCGPRDQVLKILPPLIIEDDLLHEGLNIIEQCVAEVMGEQMELAAV